MTPLFQIDRSAPFYVAGHTGMVGSAIWRHLKTNGYQNPIGRTRSELDLTSRTAVFEFFSSEKPKYVVLAAAKVGGILANQNFPVDFLSENLLIQSNVLDAALKFRVERLVFLGSSCVYPKQSPQPIKEEYLLSGPLEETNEAYAVAKIAGLKMVQAVRKQYGLPWISVMPTNLFGPGDNYRVGESHVFAALIRRFADAKAQNLSSVTNWGTGSPKREFLHVDDLARQILWLLENYDGDVPLNLGSGQELSVRELSDLIAEAAEYRGKVLWDTNMPDGTYRKRLQINYELVPGLPTPRIKIDLESIAVELRRYEAEG